MNEWVRYESVILIQLQRSLASDDYREAELLKINNYRVSTLSISKKKSIVKNEVIFTLQHTWKNIFEPKINHL